VFAAGPRQPGAEYLLLLIRHARAGKRGEWEGDDRRRPIDSRGREQSEALVSELEAFPLSRILSSPYDRCVQTVQPLAEARGLEVEVRDELSEERQLTEGADLARSLAGEPVALCVHGGLSDAAFGESQKKGETLAIGRDGRIAERLRV